MGLELTQQLASLYWALVRRKCSSTCRDGCWRAEITSELLGVVVVVFRAPLIVHHIDLELAFGGLPLLAAALLGLNDGDGCRDELYPTIPAVWSSMKFAVVVQVVLAIEGILTAEFACVKRYFKM